MHEREHTVVGWGRPSIRKRSLRVGTRLRMAWQRVVDMMVVAARLVRTHAELGAGAVVGGGVADTAAHRHPVDGAVEQPARGHLDLGAELAMVGHVGELASLGPWAALEVFAFPSTWRKGPNQCSGNRWGAATNSQFATDVIV